jgi:hypothetical protein
VTDDWQNEAQGYVDITLPNLHNVPAGHIVNIEAIELPVRINGNEIIYPGEGVVSFEAVVDDWFRFWRRS